jgi:hypothetical protein
MRDKEFGSRYDFRNPAISGRGFIDTPPTTSTDARIAAICQSHASPPRTVVTAKATRDKKAAPTLWYDTGAGDKRDRGMS